MVIVHLSPEHRRDLFDCGVEEINRYLRENANQDAAKNLSRTFVALDEQGGEANRVLGFYTLVLRHLDFETMPDERPKLKYPVPVILLAQLAVDVRFQGRRTGERLLMDAQARVDVISQQVGIYAMVLDARDERLARMYEGYDFKRRADGALQMYKSIKAIRKLGLLSVLRSDDIKDS